MTTTGPRSGSAAELTRRQALKLLGATGVAAVGIAVVPGNALADAVSAVSVDEFIANLYAARAEGAAAGSPQYVSKLYDPANAALANFERERVRFLAALGSAWNGHVMAIGSDVEILGVRLSGNVATAQLVDTTSITWSPAPRRRSAAELALRAQDPARYGFTKSPSSSPVVSSCGIRHDVVLQRAGSSWRVSADSFAELGFLGASPDLVPSSWADPLSPAVDAPLAHSATLAPAGAVRTYNYMGAVNYALAHAATGTYNTAYCNWNSPCGGGDCANFVSQCLYNGGGYVPDTSWRCFQGSCCGVTRTSASDTWVNNLYLRNWLISSGRAASATGIGSLGYGDTINYSFGSGWAHIAIVSDPTNDLICAHNTDHRNFPWSLGASSWLFTKLYVTYYG